MSTRLISGIYLRGDESATHYKDTHKARRHWSFVPKNSKKGKGKQVNKWQHAYEQANGYGCSLVYMDYTPMSDEDMQKMLLNTDPLMELFK